MKQTLRFSVFFVVILASCNACNSKVTGVGRRPMASAFTLDTASWYDTEHGRLVPVALYKPDQKSTSGLIPVLVSHGYGANRGGDYLHYSYLTQGLAKRGYFVVSIQHELPTDALMPLEGVPQIVRKPFWERGVKTIAFVRNQLKQHYPELDYTRTTLIGHSNGGDMVALFAQHYPDSIAAVITLDNRRVSVPRTRHPRIYSLRSSDQPADNGVLPTTAEQKQYGMRIIKLANTIHNDMDDSGTPAQHREILNYILSFLAD